MSAVKIDMWPLINYILAQLETIIRRLDTMDSSLATVEKKGDICSSDVAYLGRQVESVAQRAGSTAQNLDFQEQRFKSHVMMTDLLRLRLDNMGKSIEELQTYQRTQICNGEDCLPYPHDSWHKYLDYMWKNPSMGGDVFGSGGSDPPLGSGSNNNDCTSKRSSTGANLCGIKQNTNDKPLRSSATDGGLLGTRSDRKDHTLEPCTTDGKAPEVELDNEDCQSKNPAIGASLYGNGVDYPFKPSSKGVSQIGGFGSLAGRFGKHDYWPNGTVFD